MWQAIVRISYRGNQIELEIDDWEKHPFSPDTGRSTDDGELGYGRLAGGRDVGYHVNLLKPIADAYLQRMWAERVVCRLLAWNVGSLAQNVSLPLSLLARNVSRKRPLFAGPGITVCKPLQLMDTRQHRRLKSRV